MTIIDEPLALESGETYAEKPLGILTRPQAQGGWKDWVSTCLLYTSPSPRD